MVGKGWVSAAFVLVSAWAPATGAVPLPNPTIPMPTDVHATYDEASDMLLMDWSTPKGLDEADVRYIVYVNGVATLDGLATTVVEESEALLEAPDSAAMLQVSTLTASGQSALSLPILYLPSTPTPVIVLYNEGEGEDFPPQFCDLFVLRPASSPPFAYDMNCFWGIVDDIINPEEAP